MLGLKLRPEFQDRRLKGTAIELTNSKQTGATQIPAADFLAITWPSNDLLKALEAIGPQQGHPVVIIGERGQGKSHLMAALFHALRDHEATTKWLRHWAGRLNNSHLAELPLRNEMHVISESLHRHHYKFLWDLLFNNHPHGEFIRGKWEAKSEQKTDVPSYDLVIELLRKQPTALILDEFQTWFDGLTNTKQYPWKIWAFNFIQMLSEIAQEHPDLLVLVVSVRNGNTDAYQQLHRVNPVLVDFKGPTAGKDRRRLLLHRLFENRAQVPNPEIDKLIGVHLKEYLRLAEIPPADHDKTQQEFLETWPFAPHLLQLLENQVLIATAAQETRDLIKILADLYKQCGERSPVITAADFQVDTEDSVIASLLDSVADQHHRDLREKAQRNLDTVKDAVRNSSDELPHLSEVIGALWLRSLAATNLAGADPATLQIDVTRQKAIDDNLFQVELSTIVENSFNIHPESGRFVFREEENPRAKLMAFARNDKLFKDGTDLNHLAKETRFVIGGADEGKFRVIVLPKEWEADPWSQLEEIERPNKWEGRLPIIVLPEDPERRDERLGRWLKDHLQSLRNTIRYLLPKASLGNCYYDRDLIVLARATMKALEWSRDPEYKALHAKYQKDLRDQLKQRFDRFAVLEVWNFGDPARCRFAVEPINEQGAKIPTKIESTILDDLFIPEEFEALVVIAAQNNDSIAKLLRELQEPRPQEQECIPWLGEPLMKEKIIRVCARGKIAINREGMEYLQTRSGESEEDAWKRLRSKLGTGRQLEETTLTLPQSVPQSDGVAPQSAMPSVMVNQPQGGLFETERSLPPDAPLSNGQSPAETPQSLPSDNLFAPAPVKKRTDCSTPHTSALNLLGKTEAWGIGPATRVTDLTLNISSLSGAQVQKLLRSLPDGITYELRLQKEED